MENLSGKLIKGYRLGDPIGVGAFAMVYRAQQLVVARPVAIKIIWPALADHPNFIRHFENEAQLVASLEHPYIVPLYDYWREPGGAYIVMRWLRGGHLHDVISRNDWSMLDTVRVMDQVSSALALAHRYGAIHCDLKPENILLDEEGNTYLADFGIAHLINQTRNGGNPPSYLGSVAYAAPEQIVNEAPIPQTDVYSLGVILYEMLTGQHPFPQLLDMDEDDLLALRRTARLPSLLAARPNLPPALDHIIQHATALNPYQRYADTLSLTSAFRDALGLGQPLEVKKEQPDASTVLRNPYNGLQAFQEVDAPYFFGREQLVTQLVSRLQDKSRFGRFLAVIGPSGSGKSSLIKAGLVPALRRGAVAGSEHWFFVEMVPGTDPFQELERALVSVAVTPPDNISELLRHDEMGLLRAIEQVLAGHAQADIFLFIDQFEELYTLSSNSDQVTLFLDSLFTAITVPDVRLHVVITLRADFYDRPLLHPRLSTLMRSRTEVITPLTPHELEQAIVQPARQVGVLIDSGVVATLITEFNEQAGALPLLQYSLSALFEHMQEHVITAKAYKAIGGVRGALSQRADELYERFTPLQQAITRQIFLRLISLGEGTEDTRRREFLAEIMSISADRHTLQTVLDALSKARFLTFDHDPITRCQTVEVAHEALIREWGLLRRWLDESRDDIRRQRRLATMSAEWLKADHDLSFLLSGSRLDQYSKWAQQTDLILTAHEASFLQASLAEHERRQSELCAQQAREAHLERAAFNRLRQLVAVLLGATTLALLLAGTAFTQSRNAREQRNEARSARATSDANAAISHSMALKASAIQELEDGNTDLAVLLALKAAEGDRSAASQATLADVALAPGTRQRFVGHDYSVNGVDISPDNRLVASASTDATVRLWDAQTGQTLHILRGHSGDAQSVAFSPDGRWLVSGADDQSAIIWDVTTGAEVRRLTGHQGPVRGVAFSADSAHVFTASADGLVIEWEVATGEVSRRFEGHAASLLGLALSADGQHMISCARDRVCIVWDITSGSAVYRFESTSAIRGLALGAAGQAVYGSTDGILTLLDWHTGEIIQQFEGDHGEIGSIAFDPSGNRVLIGGADGCLVMWDLTTGEVQYRLLGHDEGITSVAFSRDGRLAVSGSRDTTLRLWNIQPAAELSFTASDERITGVAFAHQDVQTMLTASIDGALRIWQAAELRQQITFDTAVMSLDISPNDQFALVGLKNGTLHIIDLNTFEDTRTLTGHQDAVLSIAISADQAWAVSGAEDNSVIIWDLQSGQSRHHLVGHKGAVTSVAFSPNGRYVLSGGRDYTLIQWDVQTGAETRRMTGHTGAIYSVAISPDGRYALSGGRDALAILWNMQTGNEIAYMVGHSEPIWRVAFAPDGQVALTGSVDAVIVWDVTTRDEVQRFTPNGTPFALAVSADGQTVLTGEDRGIVQIWQLFTLDTLIEWTHTHRYLRELTCLEREHYQIDTQCETTGTVS